ncbi:hypothetical protein SNEBB_007534 [Seison nebaliae]|nr:hypothetical protein SNEBB_007534 [Seison nebaliae]
MRLEQERKQVLALKNLADRCSSTARTTENHFDNLLNKIDDLSGEMKKVEEKGNFVQLRCRNIDIALKYTGKFLEMKMRANAAIEQLEDQLTSQKYSADINKEMNESIKILNSKEFTSLDKVTANRLNSHLMTLVPMMEKHFIITLRSHLNMIGGKVIEEKNYEKINEIISSDILKELNDVIFSLLRINPTFNNVIRKEMSDIFQNWYLRSLYEFLTLFIERSHKRGIYNYYPNAIPMSLINPKTSNDLYHHLEKYHENIRLGSWPICDGVRIPTTQSIDAHEFHVDYEIELFPEVFKAHLFILKTLKSILCSNDNPLFPQDCSVFALPVDINFVVDIIKNLSNNLISKELDIYKRWIMKHYGGERSIQLLNILFPTYKKILQSTDEAETLLHQSFAKNLSADRYNSHILKRNMVHDNCSVRTDVDTFIETKNSFLELLVLAVDIYMKTIPTLDDEVPDDATVSIHTCDVINFLDILIENKQYLSSMFLKMKNTNKDKDILQKIFVKVLQDLETCLFHRQPTLKHHVYLLNNQNHIYKYILKVKEHFPPTFIADRLRNANDIQSEEKEYIHKNTFGVSFNIRAKIDKDGELFSRLNRQHSKLTSTQRNTVKQIFNDVNADLKTYFNTQTKLLIPDEELRLEMIQHATKVIEPAYQKFFAIFAQADFTKNPDKYLKYKPMEMSRLLQTLYTASHR